MADISSNSPWGPVRLSGYMPYHRAQTPSASDKFEEVIFPQNVTWKMKNVTCESKNPVQHCLIGHLHGFPGFLTLQVGSRLKGHGRCYSHYSHTVHHPQFPGDEMQGSASQLRASDFWFYHFFCPGYWDLPPRWGMRKFTRSLKTSITPGPASCPVVHGPLLTWLGNANPREKENGGRGGGQKNNA